MIIRDALFCLIWIQLFILLSGAVECPTNDARWIQIGDDCFLFETQAKLSYAGALRECRAKANFAELAKINILDPKYEQFLNARTKVSNVYPEYYINLNDLTTEGTFRWADGSYPITWNWAEGQPILASTELLLAASSDCVLLDSEGKWINVNCGETAYFVCAYQEGNVPGTGLDECAGGLDICVAERQTCVDYAVDYECICRTGYERINNLCEDINECLTQTCGANEVCVNLLGSYRCDCETGYERYPNNQCIDINECLQQDVCSLDNESCQNMVGTYTCVCDSGYVRDSEGLCSDLNECEILPDEACPDPNSYCINTVGSFECECHSFFLPNNDGGCTSVPFCCPDGMVLIGDTCHRVVDGVLNYLDAARSCIEEVTTLTRVEPLENVTNFLLEYLVGTADNVYGMWIGLSDRLTEGRYRWEDGLADLNTSQSNWLSGEPSFVAADQDCVLMDKQGNWIVTFCSVTFPFACQLPAITNCPPPDACASSPCQGQNEICMQYFLRYQCVCAEGFERNELGACEDVNECLQVACEGQNEECVNLDGAYECRCMSGATRTNGVCVDFNECALIPPICTGFKETCRNLVFSYACDCVEGYERSNGNCIDINECDGGNPCARESEQCFNTEGFFQCVDTVCASGYSRIGNQCFDIDECAFNPCTGQNEECVNLAGSYRCDCIDGFNRVENNQCVNTCCPPDYVALDFFCYKLVEEEQTFIEALTNCQNQGIDGTLVRLDANGVALNYLTSLDLSSYGAWVGVTDIESEGEFRWTADGEPVDPNQPLWSPDSNPVSGTEDCVTVGTDSVWRIYDCQQRLPSICQVPHIPCDNVSLCEIANPCLGETNTECAFENGQNVCNCIEGYSRDFFGRCILRNCVIGDESTCPSEGETCRLGFYGYTCVCVSGYLPGVNNCVDIDECASQVRLCFGANEVCENTPGSFECVCQEGYYRNANQSCVLIPVPVNECLKTPLQVCTGEQEVCIDQEVGYYCECAQGFTKSANDVCEDINECNLTPFPCDAGSAICINSYGSYSCQCNVGFVSSGDICLDVDECLLPGACPSANDRCVNLAGGFTCECDTGYFRAGVACIDINECITNPSSICQGNNEVCNNTDGGYNCGCTEGFTRINDVCIEANQPDSICTREPYPCTGQFEFCTPTGPSFVCSCYIGYTRIGDVCQPIQRCSADPTLCGDNQICFETGLGEYTCICERGYIEVDMVNGSIVCLGEDRCATESNLCPSRAICKVTGPALFECECIEEYTLIGGICLANNICTKVSRLCNENEYCQSTTPGAYECLCVPGYTKENNLCVLSSPCQTDENLCEDTNAVCVDDGLVHSCPCKQGFYKNSEGTCISLNVCDEGNFCVGLRECVNDNTRVEGYRCDCMAGLVEVNNECEADEEGGQSLCDTLGPDLCTEPFQQCSITQGLILCICIDGYIKVDGVCEVAPTAPMCTIGGNDCPVNEECTVTSDGNRVCVCSTGFIRQFEECTIEATGCAATQCLDVEEPVCGSDGQTYTNQCYFIVAQCQNEKIRYHSDGTCTSYTPCAPNFSDCPANEECILVYNSIYGCDCVDGFERVGTGQCVETNVQPGVCDRSLVLCSLPNQICVNDEVSGYRCECEAGFQLINGFCFESVDVTTCTANPTYCQGFKQICVNGPLDSYYCDCEVGYVLLSLTGECVDENSVPSPCDLDPNLCTGANTVCQTNNRGSYQCVCREGFVSISSGTDCTDPEIPLACSSSPNLCPVNERCVDGVNGAYSCVCADGFSLVNDICEEVIVTCANSPNFCTNENEECVDGVAGRTCACVEGYQRIDGVCRAFSQVGTCETLADLCGGVNEVCIDSPDGIPLCGCADGFVRSIVTFQCERPTSCAEYPTFCNKDNEVCQDDPIAGPSCICETDYQRTEDGFCEGTTCATRPSACLILSEVCRDSASGIVCDCAPGYQRISLGICVGGIPDTCGANPYLCSAPNEICVNGELSGTYSCSCASGFIYTSDNRFCVSPNPSQTCASNSALCQSESEVCVDGQSAGQYQCLCARGYVRDPNALQCIVTSMESICARDQTLCSGANEVCVDGALAGTFRCECQFGYVLDNEVCVSVPICSLRPCDGDFEVCVLDESSPSSYLCECQEGYIRDRDNCKLNIFTTCFLVSNLCVLDHEVCIDLPGNEFECQCEEGYARIRGRCRETCAADENLCGDKSTCADTPNEEPTYRCGCIYGYLRIDGACFESPKCTDIPNPCTGPFEVCRMNQETGVYRCDCQLFYSRVSGICTEDTDCCPTEAAFHINGMCYEARQDFQSFSFAQRECSLDGGNLTEITPSGPLQDYIRNEIARFSFQFAWIGLTDSPDWNVQEGNFTWLASRQSIPSNLPNWSSDQPRNSRGDEDCVIINNNQKWAAVNCFEKYFFFCQYEAIPCVNRPDITSSNECKFFPCLEEKNTRCVDTPQSYACACIDGTERVLNSCLYSSSILSRWTLVAVDGSKNPIVNSPPALSNSNSPEFRQYETLVCSALTTFLRMEIDAEAIACNVVSFTEDQLVSGALQIRYQITVGENSTDYADDVIQAILEVISELDDRDRVVLVTERGQNLTFFNSEFDFCDGLDCLNGQCQIEESGQSYCECDFNYGGELCTDKLVLDFLDIITSYWIGWTLFAATLAGVFVVMFFCWCFLQRKRRQVERKKAKEEKRRKASLAAVVTKPTVKKNPNGHKVPLVSPSERGKRRQNNQVHPAGNGRPGPRPAVGTNNPLYAVAGSPPTPNSPRRQRPNGSPQRDPNSPRRRPNGSLQRNPSSVSQLPDGRSRPSGGSPQRNGPPGNRQGRPRSQSPAKKPGVDPRVKSKEKVKIIKSKDPKAPSTILIG